LQKIAIDDIIKEKRMLDKKSIAILKSLNRLSEGCTYKVVTSDEIITNLSQKSLYDHDNVKEIMEFLEKQEFINIKFSEQDTFCYSLLPKARIYLEHNSKTSRRKNINLTIKNYLIIALSCFASSILSLLVFFYFMF
jgi:DNA-binding MarR family transcriptional regulator